MSSLRSRLKSKRSSLTVVALLLVVALFAPSVSPLLAQSTGQIFYLYDSLGRLVGVVDQQGNAATYNYDAVGNIFSIERSSASDIPGQIGITLVSPGKGKVGTPVAIFGKGFSATASQNTVTFNGTPAIVTSGAANRIVTTVPAGATTGPITVTAPLGLATSPAAFRVLGTITVGPGTALVLVGGTQQFSAQEAGSPTTNVRWAVNGIVGGDPTVGTITPEGLYRNLGTVQTVLVVTVSAIHKDDPTLSGSAIVTVYPPLPIYFAAPRVSLGFPVPPLVIDKSVTSSVSVQVTPSASPTLAEGSVAVSVAPFITSVLPVGAPRSATNLPLTITGSGLTSATALNFLRNNAVDAEIVVSNLLINAEGTQATAEITISSAAAVGARVVRITTPSGTSTPMGTSGNFFTVQ